METTKKTSSRAQGKVSRDSIVNAYLTFLLNEGKQPATVHKFCSDLGVSETTFYDHFGSFEGLEAEVWNGFITKTIKRLQADKAYAGFSVREKVLAFYYTLLEELKGNRSFVVLKLDQIRKFDARTPQYLRSFKTTFESFFEALLNDGKTTGEIAKRPYLDKRYPQLFWVHLGLILLFWKEDSSAAFEKTDAFVEKSVNLAFDLVGNGALDTAIDLGKFLYQNNVR